MRSEQVTLSFLDATRFHCLRHWRWPCVVRNNGPCNRVHLGPRQLEGASAAQRGLFFGSGVSAPQIANDAAFAAAVVADCALIVPDRRNEVGRRRAAQRRARFLRGRCDRRLRARQRPQAPRRYRRSGTSISLRGCRPCSRSTEGEDVFERHIRDVLGHFGDSIASWDVVNEAIEPEDGMPSGLLRNSIFYDALGPDYIARAYAIARAVLPTTPLYYNEYSIEYDFQDPKRAATLALLAALRKQGLIDGLRRPIPPKRWIRVRPEAVQALSRRRRRPRPVDSSDRVRRRRHADARRRVRLAIR